MSLWSVFKEAATIDQLQAAYRRLRPVRTHTPTNLTGAYRPGSIGPQVHPTAAQHAAMYVNSGLRPRVPSSMAGSIVMPKGGAVGTFNTAMNMLPRVARKYKVPLSAVTAQAPNLRADSPAVQRFVNVNAGLHEGFERRVPGRLVDPQFVGRFSHASPQVLINEHNMLTRATGPGAAEAAALFQRARVAGGETSFINDRLVRPMFGQRGVDYAQQHGYTPAMKRRLNRRMALDVRAHQLDMRRQLLELGA